MNNITNRRNGHAAVCAENQIDMKMRFADEHFIVNIICKSECYVGFETLDFEVLA